MNRFKLPDNLQPTEEPAAQAPVQPPRKSGKVAKSVRTVLSGEFLTRESLINHLPFITFLAILFFIHIALMYFFESTHRQISDTKERIEELRSEYNTTLSNLETKKQQSAVARDIEALGLQELRTPPQFIDVEPGYFQEKE